MALSAFNALWAKSGRVVRKSASVLMAVYGMASIAKKTSTAQAIGYGVKSMGLACARIPFSGAGLPASLCPTAREARFGTGIY